MKILILDKDVDYSQRFRHYLEKKYSHLQIAACDNIEAFNKQLNENIFDIVLVDVNFEEIKAESIDKIIKNAAFAYISETRELVKGQETIFKYDSVSELYNSICKAYENKKKRIIRTEAPSEKVDKKTDIITFLPVNGGAGSSTMAAACAVSMSQISEVLYINMEQRPSDAVFFDSESKKSFTDIISAMKTKYNADSIELLLKQVIQKETKQKCENLSYIKGYNNIMDCISVQPQHIDFILKILREKFSYRYIIIDTDFIVGDILQKFIFLSDKLVFVSSGSDTANIKLSKIQRYLDLLKRNNENTVPQSYLIFNQYYGLNNEKYIAGDMEVVARFARYRTEDNTRITSQKVIEEITAKQDVFEKLM